jgi:uncharacterized membrane protein
MRSKWLALASVELAGAAAAWIHLLACRVAVAERVVLPDSVGAVEAAVVVAAAALVLVALVRADRRTPGALADGARALLPALGLAAIAVHASLVDAPSFAEVVLAPPLTGLAAARLAARFLPERRRLRARPGLVVGALSALVGILFYIHAVGLLDDLALGFSDVGDYGVRIENTLRGRFMKSFVSPDLAPFFDHWNPGLLLLVPLDAVLRGVLPGARFLQAVQAAALAACGPLAFGLARRRLRDPIAAALVALAFVAAPAFTHLNVAYSYGFHPVTLALVALLGACWAASARRNRTAAALLLLAWSFEETVSIATFGAGLALATRGPTRRHGVVLAAASAGWFLLVARVVLPALNGTPYYQLSKYEHLGGSVVAIAAAPVLRPRVFWGTLLDGASLAYAATLLAPWLFLAARRPRWLLAAAPVFAFACLRDESHVKSIVLQYHTTILPWLLVGTIEAARLRRGRRALAIGVIVAAASSALLYGDAPLGRARRPWPRREGRGADLAAIEASVAPGESLAATQRVAAILVARRPDIAIVRDHFLPPADAVVLDLADGWGLARTTRAHRHARDLRSRGWRTRLARRELVVLARDGAPAAPRLGPELPALARFDDAGLALVGKTEADGRLRLTWRLEHLTDADLGAVPLDAEGQPVGEPAPVGSPARPTYERVAGEVFEDERIVLAPVAGFRFFDYLDLDRRGLDVTDVLAR